MTLHKCVIPVLPANDALSAGIKEIDIDDVYLLCIVEWFNSKK